MIVKIEIHTYNSYANTMFGHSDDIYSDIHTAGFVHVTVRQFSLRRKIDGEEEKRSDVDDAWK